MSHRIHWKYGQPETGKTYLAGTYRGVAWRATVDAWHQSNSFMEYRVLLVVGEGQPSDSHYHKARGGWTKAGNCLRGAIKRTIDRRLDGPNL